MNSAQALERLTEGNERFAAGAVTHPHQSAERRTELVTGQQPYAQVLCCVDSRVPPELVFDAGLGDLLVTRSAGQALDSAVLGSLEFGVSVLGIELLTVLGHQNCGALAATEQVLAGGPAPGGYLDSLVAQLSVSIQHAQVQGKHSAHEYAEENVNHVAGRLVQESTVLRDAVAAGRLEVVGMTYRLDDGVAQRVL